MKMLTMHAWGTDHQMTFEIDNYTQNGNLYVGLLSHDDGYPAPWQNLTINLGVKCKKNCAFIDTNNNGFEIIDWLVINNIGFLTGNVKRSGFCMYPEFEFDMQRLMEYVEGR